MNHRTTHQQDDKTWLQNQKNMAMN